MHTFETFECLNPDQAGGQPGEWHVFLRGFCRGDSESSSVFHFHIVFLRTLDVVCNSQSNGSFGDLLAVRLFAEDTDSVSVDRLVSEVTKQSRIGGLVGGSPALVVLALGVRLHVVLALKPFRAFHAIVLS